MVTRRHAGYICTAWRDLASNAAESLSDWVSALVKRRITGVKNRPLYLSIDDLGIRLRRRIAYTETACPAPSHPARTPLPRRLSPPQHPDRPPGNRAAHPPGGNRTGPPTGPSPAPPPQPPTALPFPSAAEHGPQLLPPPSSSSPAGRERSATTRNPSTPCPRSPSSGLGGSVSNATELRERLVGSTNAAARSGGCATGESVSKPVSAT